VPVFSSERFRVYGYYRGAGGRADIGDATWSGERTGGGREPFALCSSQSLPPKKKKGKEVILALLAPLLPSSAHQQIAVMASAGGGF